MNTVNISAKRLGILKYCVYGCSEHWECLNSVYIDTVNAGVGGRGVGG